MTVRDSDLWETVEETRVELIHASSRFGCGVKELFLENQPLNYL